MWCKCRHAIPTRHYVLPLVAIALLLTQAGCPPLRPDIRTRNAEFPQPVQIEPVIVEHMEDHVTYSSQFREYWHRFETTFYTLKLADGREMDVFARGEDPHVVIRNPANDERISIGQGAKWSEPKCANPPYRPPQEQAAPTTQGVRP
jgi:hypothetical protein